MNPLLIAVVPVLLMEGGKLLSEWLRHRRDRDKRLDDIEHRLCTVERKTECIK